MLRLFDMDIPLPYMANARIQKHVNNFWELCQYLSRAIVSVPVAQHLSELSEYLRSKYSMEMLDFI
jgi:hypothetical protein